MVRMKETMSLLFTMLSGYHEMRKTFLKVSFFLSVLHHHVQASVTIRSLFRRAMSRS
jgi:hypothetical protein